MVSQKICFKAMGTGGRVVKNNGETILVFCVRKEAAAEKQELPSF